LRLFERNFILSLVLPIFPFIPFETYITHMYNVLILYCGCKLFMKCLI
jgi:hypothetical protein